MADFVFTAINAPAANTLANGISSSGKIVGSFGTHGFVYSGGVVTTLDAPGATSTAAYGINSSGQITGSFTDGSGTHGFLYSSGAFLTLNDPLATGGTMALGINSLGQIVGAFNNASGGHGFLYNAGVFTSLDDPSATTGTQATGINDLGQIAGTYGSPTGSHGFLYNQGTYATEDDPSGTGGTWVQGVDNSGRSVGYYNNSTGFHGFIRNGTDFLSIDNPDGTSTAANSMAGGVITGTYFNSSGAHGWKANAPIVPVSVESEILGLYAALYNRAADISGVSYWINVTKLGAAGATLTIDNANKMTVSLDDAQSLGQAFVNTQATYFNQTYAGLSDTQFINALYVNIGGNVGDSGGVGYWTNQLQQSENAGHAVQAARAGVVGLFVHDLMSVDLSTFTNLTSQELLAAQQRQGTINNKVLTSLAYSNASSQPGGALLIPQQNDDGAFHAATAVLQGLTSDPSTVTTALIGINAAVAHQDLHLV